jgi:conjugal transfer/entry exclusion protein
MSTVALNTYAGALTAAQQQAQNFPKEDAQLNQIEAASSQSTALLQALQANTEAQLAVVQQIQRERELLIALINMQAVHYAEDLDERGQAAATTAMALNLGVAP